MVKKKKSLSHGRVNWRTAKTAVYFAYIAMFFPATQQKTEVDTAM